MTHDIEFDCFNCTEITSVLSIYNYRDSYSKN